MPNIKSAKKRVLQSDKCHMRNVMRKNSIKTALKRVVDAITANDVNSAKSLLKDAEAKLARAKNKNVLHANTVARKISRIAKRVAAIARTA